MKIQSKDGTVKVSGVQDKDNFKINEESAKMVIDSLINLYSDPEGSVVRELVSNAVDANRERDLKIKGELPLDTDDVLENFAKDKPYVEVTNMKGNTLLGVDHCIVIRDWGNGLSPDRVKKVFTVFGSSTKRVTDNLIGGFGIGAKSAFAYTDTFYVRAVHNKVARLYMLYNGNDLPGMDLVSETEVDEPNNTTITIPLNKASDIKTFEEKINNQLKFFTNVVYKGFDNVTPYTPKIAYEDEDIILPESLEYREAHKLKILVGRVVYPLDTSLIDSLKYKWYSVTGFLRFKIGEVDLVPSRENLRYTDKTIEAINEKLDRIKDTAVKQLADYVSDITDLAEGYAKYKELSKTYYTQGQNGKGGIKAFVEIADTASTVNVVDGYNRNMYKVLDEKARLITEVRTATTYSSYGRVGSSKGWKMVEVTIGDILKSLYVNEPVYYVDGKYSDAKNTYLYEEYGAEGFLVFKTFMDTSYREIVGASQRRSWRTQTDVSHDDCVECQKQLYDYILNHPNLKQYSDVENPNYVAPVKQARALGNFPYKKLTGYNDGAYANISFTMEEGTVEQLADGEDLVLYGTQEHENLLHLAFKILYKTRGKNDSFKHKWRPKGATIVKVSKDLAKHLTEYMHVEDFFADKYPDIKSFYTSYKLMEYNIETVLNIKNQIERGIPEDFKSLLDNLEEYSEPYRYNRRVYIDEDIKDDLLKLCEECEIYDTLVIERLAAVIDYINTVPLLKYLEKPDSEKREQYTEAIKQYIELVKPSIDEKLLPLPILEEVEEDINN
jgi:hypothetical protein